MLNLLELLFRVIFWINDFVLVVSDGVPDDVRSKGSEDSVAEVRTDRESFERRVSAREFSSVLISLSFDFPTSTSLFLPFSDFLPNIVLKEGAAGFSFGVTGWCDDEGRVPIGACTGR